MKNDKITSKPMLSKSLTPSCRFEEIRASKRKLNTIASLGFAEKAPRLVVAAKRTIVYEK